MRQRVEKPKREHYKLKAFLELMGFMALIAGLIYLMYITIA